MTNYEIDILKTALLKVEQKELMHFKELPDENAEFSVEFENKIQKLAKKRKTFIWQATKTLPRRVAIAFIAAIVTLCMMMSISAIRVPVIDFFVNVYEEFINIFVEDDESVESSDNIKEIYYPTYVMDGYFKNSSKQFETYIETTWKDNNGNVIILTQDILEIICQYQIDNRELDYIDANFSNISVKYFSKNDQYFFVWTNGGYLFELICPNNLQLSEIELFVNSLTIYTNDSKTSN